MEFRVSLATAVAAALLAVAVAAPAAIAAPPSCLAKNLRTHAEYSGDDSVASALFASLRASRCLWLKAKTLWSYISSMSC